MSSICCISSNTSLSSICLNCGFFNVYFKDNIYFSDVKHIGNGKIIHDKCFVQNDKIEANFVIEYCITLHRALRLMLYFKNFNNSTITIKEAIGNLFKLHLID